MRNRLILVVVVTMFATLATPASAILQFNKVFIAKYATDNDNEEFVESVKKAKCWVCHQGKKRHYHNPYGIHLVDLLDKTKDKKDEEKISKALDKVAKLHSDPKENKPGVDPKDKKSPTFGELIAAGKLPGGTLEEAKEEPSEDVKKAADERKAAEKKAAEEERAGETSAGG